MKKSGGFLSVCLLVFIFTFTNVVTAIDAFADVWSWTIDKEVSQSDLIIEPGHTAVVQFSVHVVGTYVPNPQISENQTVHIWDTLFSNSNYLGMITGVASEPGAALPPATEGWFVYNYTFGSSGVDYTLSNTATIFETGQSDTVTVHVYSSTPVPEPTTMLLLGLGLVGLAGIRRKL